jgi:flagellar motor switch protein FliG
MFLFAALIAAAPLAGAQLQHEVEERARAEVNDLLRTLCPEQCAVLSVAARVEEEDAGGERTPGFETPGARTVPVLRAVSANVLVDQRLPAAFRSRIRALIGQKLSGAGVPATVQLSQVGFPPRNPAPYVDPQPPKAPEKPPEPEQKPALAAAATASSRLLDKLIESAPVLAIAILLGTVLLVLGGLFYFAARPRQEAFYDDLPAEDAAAAPEEARPEAFPAQRARRLEKQLTDDRALRNAVLREALGKGDHALVARWVRELGEFLLDDLRGDTALAPALKALASEVAKPMDSAMRAAGLQELEGRTLAARLARVSDTDAFAFLQGVRPEAFIAAWRGVSPGAQEVALRLAPAHLRSTALRELPAAQRQEIALAWARKPEVSSAYALAAADELRARLADLHAGPAEADRALADLLDSLPREDQDALIEKLRREGDGRAFAGLFTESALAVAPLEVLSAATLAVPPAKLVAYLGGAEESLRTHVLKGCPARLRAEMEEELSMRTGVSREVFLGARREILGKLREEAERIGLQPADVRAWRPRVVASP